MYTLVEDVLPDARLHPLRDEARGAAGTRSVLPGLRQGRAVPAATLRRQAPACWRLYRDPAFVAFVQRHSGLDSKLQALPASMPHSCSLLVSAERGDAISWHHDVNYFRGDTVTVLLTLVNRDAAGRCCSSNRTCAVLAGGRQCRDTPENSVLVMRGDRVLHATEPLRAGETRLVLSMVYTTDPTQTLWQAVCMAVKDWSFFLA